MVGATRHRSAGINIKKKNVCYTKSNRQVVHEETGFDTALGTRC